MKRDDATLLDIDRASRLVESFVEGYDRERFFADVKTQSAVLHEIIIIGEAVKRLSVEFRDSHTEIPWREIAGMRDRVIHHYDSIDLELVWQAAGRDIPELTRSIEPLLPTEE